MCMIFFSWNRSFSGLQANLVSLNSSPYTLSYCHEIHMVVVQSLGATGHQISFFIYSWFVGSPALDFTVYCKWHLGIIVTLVRIRGSCTQPYMSSYHPAPCMVVHPSLAPTTHHYSLWLVLLVPNFEAYNFNHIKRSKNLIYITLKEL